MAKDCYFGAYVRFDTASKENSGVLLGADTLVGDPLTLDFRVADDVSQVWLANRFGGEVGFLDPAASRRLSIFSARQWIIGVYLSFVAYSDSPEGGSYWGEVAVVCYDPKYSDVFDSFVQKVVERLKDGTRSDIALSDQEVSNLIKSNGEWFPKKTISLPKNGAVIMKSRLSLSEKIIEQGRARNVGCYVANFLFFAAVIALVAFIIYKVFF